MITTTLLHRRRASSSFRSPLSLVVLLLLLLFVAYVARVADAKLVLNRTEADLESWKRLGPAPPHFIMRFSLAIKQRNVDLLEARFHQVSDPKGPHYGKFMSIDEINAMVAPHPETVDRVTRWLEEHGVLTEEHVENVVDCLHVNATVAVVNRLFNTSVQLFEHANGGVTANAWGEAHIPDEVHEHIDLIVGILDLPMPVKKFGVTRNPEDVDHITITTSSFGSQAVQQNTLYSTITPLFFYNAYNIRERRSWSNITETTTITNRTSTVGIISFLADAFSPNDLSQYGTLSGFASRMSVSPTRIIGTNNDISPGLEGSMDIQAVLGVNPAAPATYWVCGTSMWVYAWAIQFSNTATVPWVVSISWGSDENAQACDSACALNGVTASTYLARSNIEFMKIGLRGVTIIAASGDDGANSHWNRGCDYSGTIKLRASFPATSPYVLSVGGTEIPTLKYTATATVPWCSYTDTQLTALGLDVSLFKAPFRFTCSMTGTEQAVSIAKSAYTSGGGFSNRFARPSYQTDAVTAYLKTSASKPPSSYYIPEARGFPDVAAFGGTQFVMLVNNKVIYQGGTSLSTPIWAGIVSLMNDVSFDLRCAPMGFINPFLYTMWSIDPETFNDITVGDNKCPLGTTCNSTCVGYSTAVGWDPVTGLGTPNVARIVSYLRDAINSNPLPSGCTQLQALSTSLMYESRTSDSQSRFAVSPLVTLATIVSSLAALFAMVTIDGRRC